MLIAEQQLILIYPEQKRGSSAPHLSDGRRGNEPMMGEMKRLESKVVVEYMETPSLVPPALTAGR